MSSTADAKKTLRATLRARRAECAPEELDAAAAAVCRHLLGDPLVRAARVLAGYLAVRGELSVTPLLESRLRAGEAVLLPRVDRAANAIRFWAVPDLGAVAPGVLNIPEPDTTKCSAWLSAGVIDVVLLPGVAFDRSGHRLGQGGGYYDRFLATLDSRTLLIGVGHEWQVVEAVPFEDHDARVHAIATPGGIITIG